MSPDAINKAHYPDGGTALHYALQDGHTGFVEKLLEKMSEGVKSGGTSVSLDTLIQDRANDMPSASSSSKSVDMLTTNLY